MATCHSFKYGELFEQQFYEPSYLLDVLEEQTALDSDNRCTLISSLKSSDLVTLSDLLCSSNDDDQIARVRELGPQLNSSIFRGQRDWNWSLSSQLHRTNNPLNHFLSSFYCENLSSIVSKSKQCDNLNKVKVHNLLWGTYASSSICNPIPAVAQHYGVETNYIDFTLDPSIAFFFACTKCDEKHRYVPLADEDIEKNPYGSIIIADYHINDLDQTNEARPEIITPLPIKRPIAQKGFLLDDSQKRNNQPIKLLFKHNADFARRIYNEFHHGEDLFGSKTLDPLSAVIERALNTRDIPLKSIQSICKKLGLNECSIANMLIDNNYCIVNNISELLSELTQNMDTILSKGAIHPKCLEDIVSSCGSKSSCNLDNLYDFYSVLSFNQHFCHQAHEANYQSDLQLLTGSRRSPPGNIRDADGIPVFPNRPHQIVRGKPYGGGVLVRMDADRRIRADIAAYHYLDAARLVVHDSERRHRALVQAEQTEQIVLRGEAQRTRPQGRAKLLEVHGLVLRDDEQAIVALLVVPKEQVLRDASGSRQTEAVDLLDGPGGLVLRDLVLYIRSVQALEDLRPVHDRTSPPIIQWALPV